MIGKITPPKLVPMTEMPTASPILRVNQRETSNRKQMMTAA